MERLVSQGVINILDFHFARFITRLAGTEDSLLFLAAALVSHATGQGHVCCDLAAHSGEELLGGEGVENPLTCPELEEWRYSLEASTVVGRPGDFRPLILDDHGRLYLYRYWEYEHDLAEFIRKAGSEAVENVDMALLEEGLRRHFSEDEGDEPDWQRVAASVAVTRRFCVISGGPGTGKTSTVAKILALLVEQAGGKRMQLALSAPTGKAAARLEEAITSARQELDCPEGVKAAIPQEASTLHRLLGTLPESPRFRHDTKNPLVADAVIVDEASMVDLALMAKLVRSLPPTARLILLGDKDQLASVEAGAVLGDICDKGYARSSSKNSCGELERRSEGSDREDPEKTTVRAIDGCIVELRKSYRFGSDSGIWAVSNAIKEGACKRALSLLKDNMQKDLSWTDLPPRERLQGALREAVLYGFGDYLRAPGLDAMFDALERFRILCALRKGPYGVIAINRLVEDVLRDAGLIPTAHWYYGRPIMITANDYNLKLFNGDIGIVLPDDSVGTRSLEGRHVASDHGIHAYFPTTGGPLRRFPPARLPAHETVYAMTVHKSQGSEFHDVLLLLSDRESPVLTRELLYTGVTRARTGISVWGREDVLLSAVARRIQRNSGLRDAIYKGIHL